MPLFMGSGAAPLGYYCANSIYRLAGRLWPGARGVAMRIESKTRTGRAAAFAGLAVAAGLALALVSAPCAGVAWADDAEGLGAADAQAGQVVLAGTEADDADAGEGQGASDAAADVPAAGEPGDAAGIPAGDATFDAVGEVGGTDAGAVPSDQVTGDSSDSQATFDAVEPDGSAPADVAQPNGGSGEQQGDKADGGADADSAPDAKVAPVAPGTLLSFVYADHASPALGDTVRLAVALADPTAQLRGATLTLRPAQGDDVAVEASKIDGGYLLFEVKAELLGQGKANVCGLTLSYVDQAKPEGVVDFTLDEGLSYQLEVAPEGGEAPVSQEAGAQDADGASFDAVGDAGGAQGPQASAVAADARLWLCDATLEARYFAGGAISLERAVADWLVSLGFEEFAQAAPADDACAEEDIDAQATTLFKDTPKKAWYVTEGWLDYVTGAGLMNGYTDGSGKFGPEDSITREQVVTILYRYANPTSKATTSSSQFGKVTHFSDVRTKQYYTAAVEWAFQNGITTGYSGTGAFGVGDPISREDLATMLYRFSKLCGNSGSLANISGYPDASSVDTWAKDGMRWANAAGIITGDKATNPARLKPTATATRAEAAKMFSVLVRDTLGGAKPQAASWTYGSLKAGNAYVTVGSTVTVAPQVSGSGKGLTYQYGWYNDAGQTWSGKGDATFSFYLGGSGTFHLWCQVSDSTGISRIQYTTVYVWQSLTPKASSSYDTYTWTVAPNLTIGATNGFTYEYTWKKGADEGSASYVGSSSGGTSKSISVGSDGFYWLYVKATDPEGHSSTAGVRVRAISGQSLEMYNNIRYLTSPTDWLLAVDTYNCLTGVYHKTSAGWEEAALWYCSPGTYYTPTVKGTFAVDSKGYYFDSYGVRCYWWTQFYGDYLFHSTTYYTNGAPKDTRLGMNLSHGCVRLATSNAKWIYDNIPAGTTVQVW